MLRRAATTLARRAAATASEASSCVPSSSSSAPAQLGGQQRRAAHDLHVKHNKHVEQWMSRREDFEQEFAWDTKRTAAAFALVVAVPVTVYRALVGQAHADDAFAGRPERDFLWGHAAGSK